MKQNAELATILHAGSALAASEDISRTSNTTGILDILLLRLREYHARRGDPDKLLPTSLEDAQLHTALEALNIVCQVQSLLSDEQDTRPVDAEPSSSASSAPEDAVIGTRDLAILRTLLSIYFRWCSEALLVRVSASWPKSHAKASRPGPNIIDLTSAPADFELLSSTTRRLVKLLYPQDIQAHLPATWVTTTILNRYLPDFLKPCIALGWLPPSMATEAMQPLHEVRPLVLHLLSVLPPSQAMTALGDLSSSSQPFVLHIQKTCSFLLSRQLLRPEGIKGLCTVVLGEDPDVEDSAPLDKFEHISKILTTPPLGMAPQDYLSHISPILLKILGGSDPEAYIRAMAFSISRMLDPTHPTFQYTSHALIPKLHSSFINVSSNSLGEVTSNENPDVNQIPADEAVRLLAKLITNTDPSPTLIPCLLTPIFTELYALSEQLRDTKTADPASHQTVMALLSSWGKIVVAEEGVIGLWNVVTQSSGIHWIVDATGSYTRTKSAPFDGPLGLLTPEDVKRASETGELDFESNLLNLRPDPNRLVAYLEQIDRADVSSALFIKLLEAYQEAHFDKDGDPMRIMLYLQLVLQMQSRLSKGQSSSNILTKPEHILSFIKHVLEQADEPVISDEKKDSNSLSLDNLRIVPEHNDLENERDSDDEDSIAEGNNDHEMTSTAVNLLLSVLEANPDLSARTAPVLNEIFSLLEPIIIDLSHPSREPAREARMVLTARLAAGPSQTTQGAKKDDDVRETYQKALKLLQDPILPVRAHGLLLLRQLVASAPGKGKSQQNKLDSAYVPAILSIFLQAIQDQDSYIFLNAVQGLVAMVEGYGSEVLKSLLNIYTEGVQTRPAANLSQNDLDMKIRVGEVLAKVIHRCGEALGLYVELLVPPFFAMVRETQLPTSLRTSALSLLADCEGASAIALEPYNRDLSEAMVDLLQVETVPRKESNAQDTEPKNKTETTQSMDEQPTSKSSKLPPLRRAALHFLSLLIRSSIERIYHNATRISDLSDTSLNRARVVLSYVASTDSDDLVRVMAREVLGLADDLDRAKLEI